MIVTGIGVGLSLPSLMSTAASSLPPPSFANGPRAWSTCCGRSASQSAVAYAGRSARETPWCSLLSSTAFRPWLVCQPRGSRDLAAALSADPSHCGWPLQLQKAISSLLSASSRRLPAARPGLTAPSMYPHQTEEVSVPAQWIGPAGARARARTWSRRSGRRSCRSSRRSSAPAASRAPGSPPAKPAFGAEVPDQRADHGCAADLLRCSRPRRRASSPSRKASRTPGEPSGGELSNTTRDPSPSPVACPDRPSARQNGSS